MSDSFKHKTSRHIGGYAFYCQTPGVHWAMDPALGWYLFYSDGPSWYLMGHGYERRLGTTKLGEAMIEAVKLIKLGEVTAPGQPPILKAGTTMSDNIRRRFAATTYTLRGRTFNVICTEWTNSNDLSYDVSDAGTNFALHNESLDELPTRHEVEDLISNLETDGAALDPLFFDEAEVSAFIDSLADADVIKTGPDDAKYFRTVLTVEILTRTEAFNSDLNGLSAEIDEGDASGAVLVRVVEEVSADEMAALLIEQGSDPGFLIPES